MVLDTKLNKLIKYEIIELTPLETQIIGILSDNEFYTLNDIASNVGYLAKGRILKETIAKLNTTYKILKIRSHKGTTLYKLKENILIK